MRKYIALFILLSIGGIIYLIISSKIELNIIDNCKFNDDDFVTISNNKFQLNNKDFFPLVLNYTAQLKSDGSEIWPSPSIDYYTDSTKESMTRDSSLRDLRADMQLIKQMGFNAVRIVGIGEED